MFSPAIYSGSKIWHNTKWCEMADKYGYNITARWIREECGTAENPTGAKQFTAEEKIQLWIECDEDVTRANYTVIYAELKDELRGAVMEWGINMGQKKPTYIIGDCPFFHANGKSDAAYMHHPSVHWLRDIPMFADGSFDYVLGYKRAKEHYLTNYAFKAQKGLFESLTPSFGGLYEKTITDPSRKIRA